MPNLRPKGVLVSPCYRTTTLLQGLAGPAKERRESGNVHGVGMKRVVQDDPTGCGLACVAQMTGATYSEVFNIAVKILAFEHDGTFYTTIFDLRLLLSDFGYTLSRNMTFKSYDSISPLAILEIERSGDHNHWVVLVKCGLDMYVLDPAQHVKSDKRRDFHRLRPVSYANVVLLP